MKQIDKTSGKRTGKVENLLLAGILLFSVWGGYQLVGGTDASREDMEMNRVDSANREHQTSADTTARIDRPSDLASRK